MRGEYRANIPSGRPASRTPTGSGTHTNVLPWGGDYVSYATTAARTAGTTLRRGGCSRRRSGSRTLWCIAHAEDGELDRLKGFGPRGADVLSLDFISIAGLGDGGGCSGSAAASTGARLVMCTLTKVRCCPRRGWVRRHSGSIRRHCVRSPIRLRLITCVVYDNSSWSLLQGRATLASFSCFRPSLERNDSKSRLRKCPQNVGLSVSINAVHAATAYAWQNAGKMLTPPAGEALDAVLSTSSAICAGSYAYRNVPLPPSG